MTQFWSPWTVTRSVLISSNQVAGLMAGGEGSEGTIAAPLHRQPLRLGHLNSTRPMAAGEPVTTRVKFCQEPKRGFREGLSPVRFALGFHEQDHTTGDVGNVREYVGEIQNEQR